MLLDALAPILSCFALILVLALLVAPFIALHRTRRIGELVARLNRLEREVDRLRAVRRAPAAEDYDVDLAEAEAPPVEIAKPARIEEKPPPLRPKREAVPLAPVWSAIDWETWLGARGLGWAAVVLLLFATAFFFREIFELNLIGPVGRVGVGLFIGCLACIAGFRQHRKGWPITSQMLTAAGIVLVYLSTFASFGYYHLLEPNRAGLFLVIVVMEAFALALLYDAPAIAIMAVVGGLLNPLLLHTGEDRYVGLFTYLVVLNAGVAGVLLLRRWRALALLVIFGTNAIFWLWYQENYHPSKLTAALVFHCALAALWFGQQILGPLTRFARLDFEDAVRLVVQALFLAAAGYVLLDERIPEWMGTLALGLAIVHTALTWLVLRRRPGDAMHALIEFSLAMGFLAAVMPLQASAPWVAVCWAVQALGLWWSSLKIHRPSLRLMGFAFFALALTRFVFVQTLAKAAHPGPFLPIFNTFALSGLSIAACLIGASALVRKLKPKKASSDFVLARVVGLGGLFLVWVLLSFEAYDYFQVQRNFYSPEVQAGLRPHELERSREDLNTFVHQRDARLARSSQVAISIVWGLYAIVLLALGLRLPSRPLRWSALALFGVTLVKVLILDMENLPGLYRVGALFGLSLMMGAAAWGYQKVKISLLADAEEERNASPI